MRFLKSIVGLIAGVVVLTFAGILFVVNQATESHTSKQGDLQVANIRDEVRIVWNKFGVPHIVASSDHDAFFGLGYCHAQDRLFQMDFARRTAQGKLSEVFGRDVLAVDMYFRSMEMPTIAARIYRSITDDSRMAIEAYADGVNAYLEQYADALPFEFNALEFEPEPWTGEDCLMLSRMMSWELSVASWLDVAYAGVESRLGRARAEHFIPTWPKHAPAVVDTAARPPFAWSPNTTNATDTDTTFSPSAPPLIDSTESDETVSIHMFRSLQQIREKIGMNGSANGSNSWVSSQHREKGRGSATLANDPHLTFSLPARWYQAHLTSPQLNVVGMTIPGLPFVVAGRNDDIAWGVTNVMLDDMDYFRGRVDTNNRKNYILGNSSVPFTYIRDTIEVKDSTNVIYDRRYANGYAVVSDVHLFHSTQFTNVNEFRISDEEFLLCKWTGTLASDEILAMYRLNKAQNWERFVRAVSLFTSPALNFSYADREGNIGIAPTGRVPLRNNHPQFADDIATMDAAWYDYIEPADLPRLYNPNRKWLFSANNLLSRHLGYYVSSYWEPPSRGQRIAQVLDESEQHSQLEAAILQKDIFSMHASEIVPVLLHHISPFKQAGSPQVKRAIDTLEQWNYKLDVQSVSASIYTVWMHQLTKNLLQDELGPDVMNQLCFINSVPTRLTWSIVTDGNSPLIDNIETSHQETLADIAFQSLNEAVDTLTTRFSSSAIDTWFYGEIHTIELPHRFGNAKPLDVVVNLGPFPYPGDNTTVNNGEYKYNDPYTVHLGPSMRIIADMSDSVLQCVLPGGQSGQPLSGQYGNQVQLWLNGGTIRLPVSREPEQSQVEIMRLRPKQQSE